MAHTTDLHNTFVRVAEDCPVQEAVIPQDSTSVAHMQYTMIADRPYAHTSDDVLFTVHARRRGIPEEEWPEARIAFFSKGQACLRASPLTKRHAFGVHHDAHGRVALVPRGTEAYEAFCQDSGMKQVNAMRNKRA